MRCICGDLLDGHVCTLTHKERMIKYADYCANNLHSMCLSNSYKNITPFTHTEYAGCIGCGVAVNWVCGYYETIISKSHKFLNHALACYNCRSKIERVDTIYLYCFENIEIPSICRASKPLRVLLVRELYNQHKVPRDIRNLINSLLSCGC